MMFGRKQSIVCPMCGDSHPVKDGRHWHEDVFRCERCGCIFELDTEEFLDDDEPIFYSQFMYIDDPGRNDRFDRVLLWLRAKHPEWVRYLDDREFSGFLRDFYAYNHWLNRGNEPSFEELVEDGGFEEDVGCILGDGDSLDVYFGIQFDDTPDDEKEEISELYDRFLALRKRYGRFRKIRSRSN